MALMSDDVLAAAAKRFGLHERIETAERTVTRQLLADTFEAYMAAAVDHHALEKAKKWVVHELYNDVQKVSAIVAEMTEAAREEKRGKKRRREVDAASGPDDSAASPSRPSAKRSRHEPLTSPSSPAKPVKSNKATVKPPNGPAKTRSASASTKSALSPARVPMHGDLKLRLERWAKDKSRQLFYLTHLFGPTKVRPTHFWKAVVFDQARIIGSAKAPKKSTASQLAVQDALARLQVGGLRCALQSTSVSVVDVFFRGHHRTETTRRVTTTPERTVDCDCNDSSLHLTQPQHRKTTRELRTDRCKWTASRIVVDLRARSWSKGSSLSRFATDL